MGTVMVMAMDGGSGMELAMGKVMAIAMVVGLESS